MQTVEAEGPLSHLLERFPAEDLVAEARGSLRECVEPQSIDRWHEYFPEQPASEASTEDEEASDSACKSASCDEASREVAYQTPALGMNVATLCQSLRAQQHSQNE